MNQLKVLPALVLASLVAGAVACSGSDDASGGASAAKETMSQPASADLTGSNGTKAYGTSKTQSQSGGFSPFGGGSSSGGDLGAARIRTLQKNLANVESGCPDLDAEKSEGTCACDGGGSLDYAISDVKALKSGNVEGELDMSFVFSACKMEGEALDGKMVMIQSKSPIVDKATWAPGSEAKATTGGSDDEAAPGMPSIGATGMNILWQADKLSNGKETLDFALLLQDGETCLRPPVDGGFYYVCIGAKGVAIHAKNGSYTCDFAKGECTGDAGAAAIALEGSVDDEPSTPTGDGGTSKADGGGGGGGMTCGAKQCGASQFCCFDDADTCVDDLSACPF